ncbi:shikimate kinase [Pseudorhodoferax sp. Leaf267]|uniref:shikimate kinase n=1 Tax=Pseudorhodoferax sp. Leaf267 TaxID=1736316 RepID=UPI0006FB121F|nr:shikimate kinase [Pseudorhodoferax sp. Leaf267]KQP23217.1 shikimate kinase [Pseudorhodoferax sp. Leaf267]
MNIALVGMPGSGKSTVGRQLARRLQLPFVDADHWVEQALGCSIREYFEREGEASFRDVEAQAISDITDSGPVVIATGGGAVLRPANRECLRGRTRVFYLFATPEEVYRRLRHDQNRPLLQVADPLMRLRELFAQRDALYRETAHDVITIGRPSTAALVNTIAAILQPAPGPAA